MYQSIRVLKVFLASPSDVGPEREAAHRVVGEINASVGRELNWRVELLVWEDVGPDYARKIDRASRSTSRPKTATLRMRWSDSWANSETPSDLVHLIRLSDQIWGHSDELASLIFGIAKNPLELVLDQTLGTLLRTRLLELLSLKQIRKLKPYWIEMLKDENEAFRESAVKQIFRATNAPERVRLIDEYIWSGAYFYNVVYLLDRLTYAPAAWRTKFAATPLSSSLTWN